MFLIFSNWILNRLINTPSVEGMKPFPALNHSLQTALLIKNLRDTYCTYFSSYKNSALAAWLSIKLILFFDMTLKSEYALHMLYHRSSKHGPKPGIILQLHCEQLYKNSNMLVWKLTAYKHKSDCTAFLTIVVHYCAVAKHLLQACYFWCEGQIFYKQRQTRRGLVTEMSLSNHYIDLHPYCVYSWLN